jgi:hypothetical protein
VQPNESKKHKDDANSRCTSKQRVLNDIKSTSDLEALKACDPWMYYSITLGKAVDISTLVAALASGALSVVER